ncbi:MAG: HAD family hydrolase [Proteobacteria bacterium]|nr:HAD family hydrolase [Pseudomonadota bacterium]
MPAIFFDRDSTLTEDHGYTHSISDFAFMPGVEIALARAHAAGLPLFIVTNQGGIALGHFSEADMHAFHRHLRMRLAEAGAMITDIAFCPHHPDAPDPSQRLCDCRKPKPGMLVSLAKRHAIDLTQSVMIGDKDSDMGAAQAAGCKGILYGGGDMLPVVERALQWCRQGG